jgi:HEAT repeat protein
MPPATKTLRSILLTGLATTGLGIAGLLVFGTALGPHCRTQGASMTIPNSSMETVARQKLLENLLEETITAKWSELYIRHGAPIAEEVPFLAHKASSSSGKVRRNAARLLALSTTHEAKVALRKLVAETSDPAVFGRALAGLLREPDAKEIAGARPKLVAEALHSDDPEAVSVAVQAAPLIGLTVDDSEMRRRLFDPDYSVRTAMLEVLAQNGAGVLDKALRELILADPQNLFPSKTNMYAALAKSSDPQTAILFRQSLKDANTERVLDFTNGIFLSHSRQPWLRDLLLSLAEEDGSPARWVALDKLWDWNEPALQHKLSLICLTQLEKRLPHERSDKLINDSELDTCIAKLNMLLGHEYSFRELFELRDAARARLSLSAPPGTVPLAVETDSAQ